MANSREEYLSLRIPPKVKEALKQAAEEQARSMSKQAVRYIEAGLIAEGLLDVEQSDVSE